MIYKENFSSEKSPVYWKGNVQDVEAVVQKVKRGKVHKLRPSAGGRPIYMIEYGTSNMPPSQATLSSALGARDYAYYADKSGADYCPALFMAGCVHGGEFEGTVAILNLIHLMEYGVDYAGNGNHELCSLLDKVHLLLLPMSNPDGRTHIPFDNFVGRTLYDLRYYNQGTWKDGSLCGWPQCKRYLPIKEHVDYLGGYYNDDGINIMHDDFFGKPSAETRNILDVCREYAPDVSVLFHGGTNCKAHVTMPGYVSGSAKKKTSELVKRAVQAYRSAGFEFYDNSDNLVNYDGEQEEPPMAFNLISAMHHCCGEVCVTYESNQGLVDHGEYILDNEEIYMCHNLFIRSILEFLVVKP